MRQARVRYSEIYLLVQTSVLIVVSSWAMGGKTSWAPQFIFMVSLLSMGAPILKFNRKKRFPHIVPWVVIPVTLFCTILIISCLNPSYTPVSGSVGRYFESAKYISWLPNTVTPNVTINESLLLIALLIQGTVTFLNFNKRKSIRILFFVICVNILVLAVVGSFFKISGSREILGVYRAPDPRYFFASFTYKNHWAAFVILSISSFSALCSYFFNSRFLTKDNSLAVSLVFLGALLITMFTVLLSESKSGCILLAIFFVVFVIQLAFQFIKQRNISISFSILIATLVLILLPTSIWFLAYNLSPSKLEEPRLQTMRIINDVKSGVWESRVYTARDTFKMFLARPFWGWGLGSYPMIFNKHYQGKELSEKYFSDPNLREKYDKIEAIYNKSHLKSDERKLKQLRSQLRPLNFKYAHNDWLQYFAEIGIWGMAILLTPIAVALKTVFIKGRKNPFTTWGLISCGLFALYACFEFPTRTPANLILLTILLASSLRYGLLEARNNN